MNFRRKVRNNEGGIDYSMGVFFSDSKTIFLIELSSWFWNTRYEYFRIIYFRNVFEILFQQDWEFFKNFST